MDEKKKVFQPLDDTKTSSGSAVGRRVAKLLEALDTINTWVVKGTLVQECDDFRGKIIRDLEAEGWRIYLKNDKYQVLPPK